MGNGARLRLASTIVGNAVSILVAQLVPEGVLFGADRNITISVRQGALIASGQSARPKVLKWPNHEVVVGYVGRAEIDGQPIDEWLYDFIGRNLERELQDLAYELKSKLEHDLGSDAGSDAMILHLAGFIEDGAEWTPQIWFIRNAHGMDTFGYKDVDDQFEVSDEIPRYFTGQTGKQIRARVGELAHGWQPFWFHQGYDLGTFNTLDAVLRGGMRAIVETHPARPHAFPDSLVEWSKHLKMAILAYGAYFAAFHEPFQQYVGGGADVVWAEWPKVAPIA